MTEEPLPMPNEPDRAFEAWYRKRRPVRAAAPARVQAKVLSALRQRHSAPAWGPRLAWGMALLLLGFGLGALVGRSGAPKMTFRLEAPRAEAVALAASFNGWQPQAMRRDGDSWVIELAVPQGRQQYAFVVNGRRWLPDPDVAEAVLAEDGRVHSVLDVGPAHDL